MRSASRFGLAANEGLIDLDDTLRPPEILLGKASLDGMLFDSDVAATGAG
jgi:hypothetical protein